MFGESSKIYDFGSRFYIHVWLWYILCICLKCVRGRQVCSISTLQEIEHYYMILNCICRKKNIYYIYVNFFFFFQQVKIFWASAKMMAESFVRKLNVCLWRRLVSVFMAAVQEYFMFPLMRNYMFVEKFCIDMTWVIKQKIQYFETKMKHTCYIHTFLLRARSVTTFYPYLKWVSNEVAPKFDHSYYSIFHL